MVTLFKIHYIPGNFMDGMFDIYKSPIFSLMQSNPTHPLALKKIWESKGDPKEPNTQKKNHCSTLR
jgi:hypothetical protein